MSLAWAQRREEMLNDCLVSPDVFHQMVERLGEFVVPYQQALATEADQHPMQLYLQGLLSQLPRKNAEAIAAWVDVERQVMQDFIGTVLWDHLSLSRLNHWLPRGKTDPELCRAQQMSLTRSRPPTFHRRLRS